MDVKQLSLKIVGFIWMLVGLGLSLAGINWMLQLGFGVNLIIFLTTALVIGLLKGKFVLQKVAKKYYKRSDDIQYNRNDIFTGWAKIMGIRGGVLIAVMMTIGMILRHSNIDRPILGIIYLAVGIALLYASKVFFKSQIANS
ncbi:MAG: hypothetical protein HYR97_02675 [Candidatus Melainabacteria bacterium]|nr:hypothetical protein [Candidatus Melainabacteria bacterium]MBI3309405.1 hypothetical protein [Candidatus Melainabacteria bacterium]